MKRREAVVQNIPRGWASATVGTIADYINGLAFKPSDWKATGRPIIRIQNLTGQSDHLNLTTREVNPAYIVKPGTILVSWSATLDVFVWRGPEAVLNQHIFKVVPVTAMSDHSFVRWALKNSIDEMWRGEHTHGTTMRHINRGPFLAHRLVLPPVSEQVRIAEAIESYLTRLDDAVASLERVQAKLKAYRASVLKAAVEGRLVPTESSLARAEGRSYEPAEALLARVLKERRRRWEEAELAKLKATGKTPKHDKWKAKYQEPAAPDASTLPDLPEGWCWAGASALCTAIGDVDHKMPAATQRGIPYVSTRDFRGFNDIDFAGAKLISEESFERLCRKIRPQCGDLLLSRYGTVGEVRLIGSHESFQASYSIAILKPVDASVSAYMAYALRAPGPQAEMRRWTRASAQPDLGLAHIRQLAIPLPPAAEQERVRNEVDRLLSIAAQIDVAIAAEEQRIRRLRQAVLKWAFEGKLVDQDPSDEPAESLLARIRADRAAIAPTEKGRSRRAKGEA